MNSSRVKTDYGLAKSILGPDFITPQEVATARGLAYTEAQLTLLGRNLPDQATLEALKQSGMMLIAGPPTAMTMLDVRAVHVYFFCTQGPEQNDRGWYDEANEKFVRTDKIKALNWFAFRKEPVEDSLNMNWPDQQALVVRPMMIPNAAEVTWALTTYKAVRDIYLLDLLYVRTSSRDSDGYHIRVGHFDSGGLYVSSDWEGYRNSLLGLSACMQF